MKFWTLVFAAEQPEELGSPGRGGEQVHVDPHLRSEDEPSEAAGPEQQRSERPASGHGQVTGDVATTCNQITLSLCSCACRLEQLETLFVHKNNLSYLPVCLTNISTLRMIVVSGDQLTCIPTKLCSSAEIK